MLLVYADVYWFTPKAFANCSPVFEAKREPWVAIHRSNGTLKGFGSWRTLSGFGSLLVIGSQGCRWRSNLGPGISERLRRYQTGLRAALSNWTTRGVIKLDRIIKLDRARSYYR